MCVNKKLFLTSNSQFRGVARKSYLGGEGGGGIAILIEKS